MGGDIPLSFKKKKAGGGRVESDPPKKVESFSSFLPLDLCEEDESEGELQKKGVDMKFIVDRARLSAREKNLLKVLEKEYTPCVARDVLLPFVTQTSLVSLRALDWCVTNWSKQHNVVCSSQVPGQLVNIHHAYRGMLAYWKRKLFDPFRRRVRVEVEIEGRKYETTLGQANFALWSYQTGVLAYVMGHINEIEADMNSVSHKHKLERREDAKKGRRRRRKELTHAPRSLCVAYVAPSRVSFEEELVLP